MTQHRTRRQFLADVGRAALVNCVGLGLAWEVGFLGARGIAFAGDLADAPGALSFGPLEPLVALLQETAPDRLLELLVDRLAKGTDLKTLLAAGALANARTFGGEDYVGYHVMMALGPAWTMAEELPAKRRALPVLKVLYRNTSRIQAFGGRKNEVLRELPAPSPLPSGDATPGEILRAVVRAKDVALAEGVYAALGQAPARPDGLLDDVLFAVEDDPGPSRGARVPGVDLSKVIGADTQDAAAAVCPLLREERGRPPRQLFGKVRSCFQLLEAHLLLDREPGTKPATTPVDATSRAIFEATPTTRPGSPPRPAEGVPRPTSRGDLPRGEPAALRDPGAPSPRQAGRRSGPSMATRWASTPPAPRTPGATSRAGHAAEHVRVPDPRPTRRPPTGSRRRHHVDAEPDARGRRQGHGTDPVKLLTQADEAIRAQDQTKVRDRPPLRGPRPPRASVFACCSGTQTEDGALHAEKYYRTVVEEFAATRPTFRWRHLDALARVTASEYGQTAAGIEEASKRLGV
jgi:hypothetical protein